MPSMMSETNLLIQLLTGGQSEPVTVVCDNGEIKINITLLVSLYTILSNLVRGLGESNVILFKGVNREDLMILFERLFQRVTEFSPKEQLLETILSLIVSNELDSEACKESEEIEPDRENQDPELAIGFPNEDHDYLEKETPVLIKIKKQRKRKSRGKFYKCHICGIEILNPIGRPGSVNKVRSAHLSTAHGFQLEKCGLCGMECVELNKHLESRHPKCLICDKSILKKNFERHMRNHKRLEAKAKGAKAYEAFKAYDPKREKTKCPYCDNLYSDIRTHLKERCKKYEYEKEVCTDCGKVFNNKSLLREHVYRFHQGKKKNGGQPQMCNLCGKILCSESSLWNHHRATHEIRKLTHECELCGKMFGDEYLLKSHKNRNHIEKTPCPVCGIKVRRLQDHMDSVHRKDEDKTYQCQDCGKGFMHKPKLEKHRINVHLKTKPYPCRYGCDISYNDDSNRNSHEKKTHGKLFTTVREEKLKEKIELLGLDEKLLTTGIM